MSKSEKSHLDREVAEAEPEWAKRLRGAEPDNSDLMAKAVELAKKAKESGLSQADLEAKIMKVLSGNEQRVAFADYKENDPAIKITPIPGIVGADGVYIGDRLVAIRIRPENYNQ